MEIHSPKNDHMIENIWIFCSVDEGGEGVIAADIGGTLMPLIASDEKRLALIRVEAMKIARMHNKKVILKKFSTCEIVEEF